MNPFCTPDRLFISTYPCDMRSGIQRLASIITCDFGCDPADGALYCFVSRDCKKIKLLRFDVNGWCMYYIRLAEGGFHWEHSKDGKPFLTIERRQLIWLLDGIDCFLKDAPAPITAHTIL